MAARIIVDEGVPPAARPAIVETLSAALRDRGDPDSLIAVVTKLPSGRLTVFVNLEEDTAFVTSLEAALARLR